MEMHQIRYFLAVCDYRNFTQAAQSTYVSQPSLTQAIKNLEDEFGGELFFRDRRGCRLTPLGCLVEPRLRHIYQNTLTAKSDAIRFTRLKKTPIRVGIMTTIGAQRLSPFFARYQREHPNTELELIVDTEATLLKQLHSGFLDLVISAPLKSPGKSYHSTLLYQERYIVVFNAAHSFAKLNTINLQMIQSEPYLDRLNCELRETLKSICNEREINLYATYRSNNEEWILNMARAGIGVALIPEYTLPCDAEDVRFHYLEDPEITRQVFAICSAHMPQLGEVSALVQRLERGI
jgi:DNA-binding transcriptional LysR family regulator